MLGTARLAIGFAILAQPLGAMAQTPQLRPDKTEFRALYQELRGCQRQLPDLSWRHGRVDARGARYRHRRPPRYGNEAIGIPSYGPPGLFGDPDGNGTHGLNEREALRAVYTGRDLLTELVKAYADAD